MGDMKEDEEDEVDGGGDTASSGCGVEKLVAELDAIVLIYICAKCLIYLLYTRARRHTLLQVATVATKQRNVIDHRSSIMYQPSLHLHWARHRSSIMHQPSLHLHWTRHRKGYLQVVVGKYTGHFADR
jgi:hypothetical protein